MAFFRYADRPGMIGKVGTILGDAGINIASMQVGRTDAGGTGAHGHQRRHARSAPRLLEPSIASEAGMEDAWSVEL